MGVRGWGEDVTRVKKDYDVWRRVRGWLGGEFKVEDSRGSGRGGKGEVTCEEEQGFVAR